MIIATYSEQLPNRFFDFNKKSTINKETKLVNSGKPRQKLASSLSMVPSHTYLPAVQYGTWYLLLVPVPMYNSIVDYEIARDDE